jgi:hypothetical protein
MKKLIVTCLAALCILGSYAQEKVLKEMDAVKISKTDAPDPVVKQAEIDFPGASPFQYYAVGDTMLSKDWKITEEQNFSKGEKINHYSVEMRGKDSYYHALYDANGKLLMSRKEEKNVALPKAIMTAYESGPYRGIPLKKDKHYKITDHGKKKNYYEVYLTNGKKLMYNADGTLIKK